MSDIKSLASVAMSYAVTMRKGERQATAVRAHADYPKYLDMAGAPKVGKASPTVAAAKALLGIDDARGTKSGPRGQQVWTKYDVKIDGTVVTGQLVESVASLLKADLAKSDPESGIMRFSLSGEGGGSVKIPTDAPADVVDYLLSLLSGE